MSSAGYIRKSFALYGHDRARLINISPYGISELLHAVETRHDTFIVSHMLPRPQVCEVLSNGVIVRVYGGQLQLGRPVYLALDSDDRVFVADYDNSHVLLLDSLLSVNRVLLDIEQHPQRLCYTESTGQLIVSAETASKLTQFAALRVSCIVFMLHAPNKQYKQKTADTKLARYQNDKRFIV